MNGHIVGELSIMGMEFGSFVDDHGNLTTELYLHALTVAGIQER